MKPAKFTTFATFAAVAATTITPVSAKIYFHEKFESLDKWYTSGYSQDYGQFVLDTENKKTGGRGLISNSSDKHYAFTAPISEGIGHVEGFNNEEKTFVLSFTYQHNMFEKNCDGGYLKLMGGDGLDPTQINDKTPYQLMFGPDRCDDTHKIQFILGGYGHEIEWAKTVDFPQDPIRHAYTLAIFADDTYKVFVDKAMKKKGKLKSDFPRMLERIWVPNPDEKKPADWVDEPTIADPDDEKPEDWEDEQYVDIPGNPSPPYNWDEEKQGKWVAPKIPNVKWRGAWAPRRIANPAYKGEWSPKKIRNEAFDPSKPVHIFAEPIQYVSIDVYQRQKGGRFGDIIIGDDVKEVANLMDESGWKEQHAAETAQWAEMVEAKQKQDDERAAKRAEAEKMVKKQQQQTRDEL